MGQFRALAQLGVLGLLGAVATYGGYLVQQGMLDEPVEANFACF